MIKNMEGIVDWIRQKHFKSGPGKGKPFFSFKIGDNFYMVTDGDLSKIEVGDKIKFEYITTESNGKEFHSATNVVLVEKGQKEQKEQRIDSYTSSEQKMRFMALDLAIKSYEKGSQPFPEDYYQTMANLFYAYIKTGKWAS